MANTIYWFQTKLPKIMINEALNQLVTFENEAVDGLIDGDDLNKTIRDSKVFFLDASNWLGGFIWYYIQQANNNNFRYDITDYDDGSLQYTIYGKDQFYSWHRDQDIDTAYECKIIPSSETSSAEDKVMLMGEHVRKLSFSLQLNGANDYKGGELEIEDNQGNLHEMEKGQGNLTIFDSRMRHRVNPISKGIRRSLVGWVIGPRWK
jgi:PKHD-type hydroxylase